MKHKSLIFILCYLAVVCPVSAKDWYVSPDVLISGGGSKFDPMDLSFMVGSKSPARPGDRIILLQGTYKYPGRTITDWGYSIKLKGTKENPITVMADYGKRVTIDGGILIAQGSQYLVVDGLEIVVSENFIPQNRIFKNKGSFPEDRHWPHGGVWVRGGIGSKYVNLIIHDNSSGFGFWKEGIDSEIYGCIIYNNGWSAPDRGHGHAIYFQNNKGYKVIEDCIMTGGYGFTTHGWVETPNMFVNNIKLEGNIVYNSNHFLVGGLNPSKNILLVNNYFYNNKGVDLGYPRYKGSNKNCIVINNLFVDTPFHINNFDEVTENNNKEIKFSEYKPDSEYKVILRKNKYDPKRANIAIYNWKDVNSVEVDISSMAAKGDDFRFMNPTDFFGKPVLEGTYNGESIAVKVDNEFAAFVLLVEKGQIQN